MAGAIPSAVLDGLVEQGRKRGRLTTDDLTRALPIHAMTPDEIALVVAHLEDAGVPVEVDEALLGGRPRPIAQNAVPAARLREPAAAQAAPAPVAASPGGHHAPAASPPATAAEPMTVPLMVFALAFVVALVVWYATSA